MAEVTEPRCGWKYRGSAGGVGGAGVWGLQGVVGGCAQEEVTAGRGGGLPSVTKS